MDQATDADFAALTATGPVVVEFWASWCAPCKAMAPFVERVANNCSDRATIIGLNIDRNPAAADRLAISSVPTFVALSDGREVARGVGAQTESQLLRLVEQAIGQAEHQGAPAALNS